ncbi:uncharacterized protein VTP21DRAFT_2150 [Calcarisporiella thermophila]|uniref:uncharacterized protein n=1 Tax=Calcarisporiella thermophila TaxID=911321 RepID=UPI0037439830
MTSIQSPSAQPVTEHSESTSPTESAPVEILADSKQDQDELASQRPVTRSYAKRQQGPNTQDETQSPSKRRRSGRQPASQEQAPETPKRSRGRPKKATGDQAEVNDKENEPTSPAEGDARPKAREVLFSEETSAIASQEPEQLATPKEILASEQADKAKTSEKEYSTLVAPAGENILQGNGTQPAGGKDGVDDLRSGVNLLESEE